MHRPLLATMLLGLALAVPSGASAATITFSGSTSIDALSNGSAVFDGTLVRVTCAFHNVSATSLWLSRRDSANTSLVFDSLGFNSYSSCTYTTLLGSGNVAITNGCGWNLTAVSTTAATITIPVFCTTMDFWTGVVAGCQIRIDAQSVAATMSVTLPRTVTISLSRAPVTFSTNGRCAGISRGTMALTESMRFTTVGMSAG